ncbi:MAG: GNAT family N-acetyltransferase [Lawsonibacter sp.]|jgi:predicted GNAT family acetyltransferase
MDFQISSQRIWLEDAQGNEIAFVAFPAVTEHTVKIVSTVVDPSLRGQGVANALLEKLTHELRATGKTAVPLCSYAVSWFEKHPEENDLLYTQAPK